MLSCFGVCFFCFWVIFVFSALVCSRLYLVICVLYRVYVRHFFVSIHWEFSVLVCFGFRIVVGSV